MKEQAIPVATLGASVWTFTLTAWIAIRGRTKAAPAAPAAAAPAAEAAK